MNYPEFQPIEFNVDEPNLLDSLRHFVENGIDLTLVNAENEAQYIEDVVLPELTDDLEEVKRRCRIARRTHEWDELERLKVIADDINYDLMSVKGRMSGLLELAEGWEPTRTSMPPNASSFERLDNFGQEYLDILTRSVDGLTNDDFVTILEDIEHLNRNALISKLHYAAIGYGVSTRLAAVTCNKRAGWADERNRFKRLYRSLKCRVEQVPLYEDSLLDTSSALTENELVTAIDSRARGVNDWNLFLYSKSLINLEELQSV